MDAKIAGYEKWSSNMKDAFRHLAFAIEAANAARLATDDLTLTPSCAMLASLTVQLCHNADQEARSVGNKLFPTESEPAEPLFGYTYR